MATVTHRTALADTANVASYTTPAFTPAPGDLLVVRAFVSATVSSGAVTASGNGLTFVRAATGEHESGVDRLYLFVSNQFVGPASTAMTLTLDVTGDSGTGAHVIVTSISDVPVAGLGAVRQVGTSNNRAFNTVTRVSFPEPAVSGNPQLVFLINSTAPTTAVASPPGFRTEVNSGYTTPSRSVLASSLASGSSDQTVTWGSVSQANFAAMAVELAAAPTGATLPATGTIAASTTTSATTNLRANATGTAAATSATTAATTARLTTTGTIAATSTTSGSATLVTGPATLPAAGTVTATTTATGTAALRATAAGTTTATTSLSGSATTVAGPRILPAAGTATATTAAAAEATLQALTAGAADATSLIVGSATIYGQVEVIKGATQVTLTSTRTSAAWRTPPEPTVVAITPADTAHKVTPQPGTSVVISTRNTHVTL